MEKCNAMSHQKQRKSKNFLGVSLCSHGSLWSVFCCVQPSPRPQNDIYQIYQSIFFLGGTDSIWQKMFGSYEVSTAIPLTSIWLTKHLPKNYRSIYISILYIKAIYIYLINVLMSPVTNPLFSDS
jgi:hypothetical protein